MAAPPRARRLGSIDYSSSSATISSNGRRVSLRTSSLLRTLYSRTPPVQARMEESLLIQELLLLDGEVMRALKEDWLSIDKKLTREEFVFLLSKHISRCGPLDNPVVKRVPQERLLSAILEAFEEINCYRAEKGVVDWVGFSKYLIFSTRLIRPVYSSKAAAPLSTLTSTSFKMLPLPMREQRRNVAVEEGGGGVSAGPSLQELYPTRCELPKEKLPISSEERASQEINRIRATPYKMKKLERKVAFAQYLPHPVNKLAVCDYTNATRAIREFEDYELLGTCRLGLWHFSADSSEVTLHQVLDEPTTLLRCAVVVSSKGVDQDHYFSQLLIPRSCLLATTNFSERQVETCFLWSVPSSSPPPLPFVLPPPLPRHLALPPPTLRLKPVIPDLIMSLHSIS